MGTFVALSAMRARRRFANILKVKGEKRRFIREAEDFAVFSPRLYKRTLDVLAQCGVVYTVLAPWQAATPVDITQPYIVRGSSDRSITVFFYNDLSGAVSYNDDATVDANQFASDYQRTYPHRDQAAGRPQITIIATDGELYGHHKPLREKFLSHFLSRSASAYGLSVCSLERYLLAHPATKEVEIHEPSSWSCSHGVDRWNTGCACTEGRGDWKEALREAITQLALAGHGIFEYLGEQILTDPWAARNDYLALRNGWELPERFWARHGRSGRMDIASIMQAQQLLEAEYWLQYSFTSCGFFFEDLDRIEPSNNIAFARRAISLIFQASGHDLQSQFVKNLAKAVSWRTGRTGADLYHALPAVPIDLLPQNVLISQNA